MRARRPARFFRYEDRMDAGEDFSHIYPDVVREQGEDIAPIFATTSNITATPAAYAARHGRSAARPEAAWVRCVGTDELVS